MTKQTRRRFSPEYKEQSVARLSEPGATHSSVAAELGVTPTQLKTWRLVYFVRYVLRAQRAACQAPDDHVLKGRLARPVKAANQSDIPVDLDDEVLRVLAVQPAMSVQPAETVGLDAPQGPEPFFRLARCLRRPFDRRVFFRGLKDFFDFTRLHRLGSRPQVTVPSVVRKNPARIVVLKDERRAAFRHGNRLPVQQSRDQILQTAVNEIDRRQSSSAAIFAIGN